MSKLVKKALMVLCAGVFSASIFAATPATTTSGTQGQEGAMPQAMATTGNPAATAKKAVHKKHHQRMKACMKKGGSRKSCKEMMAKKHQGQMKKQQDKPAVQQ